MKIYDHEDYSIPSIKRNIIRYFLVAERAKGAKEGDPPPETAAKASQYLKQLEESDPKTYRAAKRFFILN